MSGLEELWNRTKVLFGKLLQGYLEYFTWLCWFILMKTISILVTGGIAVVSGLYYSTSSLSRMLPRFKTVPPPFIGIKNKYQNCYLNTMIQVCASSDVLKKKLDSERDSTHNFNLFVKILNDTSKRGNSPSDISSELDGLVKSCGWNKTTQEDPFQLLSKLINSLEEEIPGKILPPNYRMCNKNGEKHRYQKYLGLSISLTGNYKSAAGEKIETLINNHFAEDFIDNDPKRPMRVVYDTNSPDVLLIHVQANEYDYKSGQMVKPDYRIIYPASPIELELPVIDQSEKISTIKCSFQLTGVVEHKGIGILAGHYIAHRRLDKDNWYTLNNDRVSRIEFQDITKSPYIFMYEKID